MRLVGKITWSEVYHACVEHQWYTRGDCRAYEQLAENVDEHKDVNLADGMNAWCVLTTFAEDIKAHSDTDYDVENIAYVLLQGVHWCFVDEDEED